MAIIFVALWLHIYFSCRSMANIVESFQLQMRILFPFLRAKDLRAKDLRASLLIMRTCSCFTLLYIGDTYARLVYTRYKNISA